MISIYFYRLPNDLAKYISEQICEFFPTEVIKTYYISPLKKRDAVDKKCKPSKGKLVSMWRNKIYRNKKFDSQVIKTLKNNADNVQDGSIIYLL